MTKTEQELLKILKVKAEEFIADHKLISLVDQSTLVDSLIILDGTNKTYREMWANVNYTKAQDNISKVKNLTEKLISYVDDLLSNRG